jgi:ABC-2 type transport system ATP-binding protein
MGRLKGLPDDGLADRVQRALARVGLEGTDRKRCDELSKGMQQKVQFLAAIIHEPDLLILDEPFSGLDPVSARQLRDLVLEEHGRGATVLFSTHVMQQAEEICHHVVMIHRGCKVMDEQVATIRRRYDPRRLRFDPLDMTDPTLALNALAEVERVTRVDGSYEILLTESTDPAAAIRRIVGAVPPARIEISRPKLEDVFIQLVSDGRMAAPEPREAAGLRDLATPIART